MIGTMYRNPHPMGYHNYPSKSYIASKCVELDFLMPNGILIIHAVRKLSDLAEIKAEVWEKAREYPLFGNLKNETTYHFTCINSKAETIELLDENVLLQNCDIFMNMLKIVERKGNEEEKRLNLQIGKLIGKGLTDFDALKDPEVTDFRWRIRNDCDDVVRERNKLEWENQVLYHFPCRLAASPELPQYIKDRMSCETLYVGVHFGKSDDVELTFTIPVHHSVLPSVLLEMAFSKKMRTTFENDNNCREAASEHILKILGKEEYLVCNYPLSSYITVREFICQNQIHIRGSHTPQHHLQLIVVSKRSINVQIDEIYGKIGDFNSKSSRASISASTLNKKKSVNLMSAWEVSQPFKIKIGSISHLTVESEDFSEVSLECELYHASNPLGKSAFTQSVSVSNQKAEVEEELEFEINVCNIPRSTRLCIAVYENQMSKGKNRNNANIAIKHQIPIAWVNTTVYDYRNHFKNGSVTLYCWSVVGEQDEVEIPNPLGTVVANPNHDRAVAITVTFSKCFSSNSTIVYPSKEFIIAKAQRTNSEYEEPIITTAEMEELRMLSVRDPLCELHEQERKSVWTHRNYCLRNLPQILPKLLQCVEWANNEEVAEILLLLEQWKHLAPNLALELLDYAYADPDVRSYAVDCITSMSDDDLLLYLLQLVQAIKHENYLYCDLVIFLLQRALKNQRIGHFIFWHLRSEMHVQSVSIRFGLILEAYCRGAVEHMKLLQKQYDAISKMKDVQNMIKSSSLKKGIVVNQQLQESLQHSEYQIPLSRFLNPIDPTLQANSIKHDKCKAMDSKMQPLWLVFANSDIHAKDMCILYKKGDDLRQDMLTIQMIRIMDKLWKDNGLDLRMNPYSCLSTGNKEGLIQVVTKAFTIYNIQKQRNTLPFNLAPLRKESLLEWLQEQNPTRESLDTAIHEFTRSCAGYSVATYVLGIGDRHNDNIMITPSGQLFHIDFGHILGHYKEKYGIRRERQPFVISHDFIYVMQKGKDTKSDCFADFKEKCEEAFMLLRRHGSFIISLFAMMISTGLPELQGEKDLAYLSDALKLNLNDEEALAHFRSKFKEALKNIAATTANWIFHAMRVGKNTLL